MKNRYVILPALLLLAACSGKELYYPEGDDAPVTVKLPLASLSGTGSRAAVESWDRTTISLAYRSDPQTVYTENVNAVVQSNADQIINLGMQYPLDGSEFYVRGYHPAASPDVSGIVHYDISRGDLDVMCSNPAQGNQTTPIIASDANKLLFEHKLTRITIRMICASGQTYPERIAALIVTHADGTFLPSKADLDLATGNVTFRAPGTIMAGYKSDGVQVPPFGGTYEVIDAMVKPGVGLGIRLLSTGDNETKISLAGSSLSDLESLGGAAGKQYVINLVFSSSLILVDQVSVVEWGAGATMPNPPTEGKQWW